MAWSLDELRTLEFASGESVRDPRDWPRRRRQLQNLFEEVMYGPWPSPIDLPGLEVSTLCSDAEALDGTATLTELAVSIADPDCRFRLLLLTPHARGPHRCFLGVNFHGNHTVIDHAGVALHDRWTVEGRGLDRGHAKDRWDVRGTVSAGQAVATFFCGDLVQDRPDLAAVDLHGFVRDGRRPGALMVWAWGLAVARTVLSARADIAADAIVAVGHSRLGKAALLAGGWDAGFAAVIAAQSGTGGAAPSRKSPERCLVDNSGRPEVETIEAITTSFPHWFSSCLGQLRRPGRRAAGRSAPALGPVRSGADAGLGRSGRPVGRPSGHLSHRRGRQPGLRLPGRPSTAVDRMGCGRKSVTAPWRTDFGAVDTRSLPMTGRPGASGARSSSAEPSMAASRGGVALHAQ